MEEKLKFVQLLFDDLHKNMKEYIRLGTNDIWSKKLYEQKSW